MTEENKEFIGSQSVRKEGTVDVGARPNDALGPIENMRDTSGDQNVTVRALKTFHKSPDLKGEMAVPGDEFETTRSRAMQLRANGLIEYPNESDGHAVHGEESAKKLDEKIKRDTEMRKIPENSRTTPLRNPEVKMAEAPADSGKRR